MLEIINWLISMFKGLGAVSFNYSGGTVSGSNGWSYSIRARFDSQLASQPQYNGISDGWRYIANMAIGLADDDYRARFGVMPAFKNAAGTLVTNLSEFGQWIDNNRQAVYNEAQGWFTYVPSGGGGSNGGSTGGGGGSTGGSGSSSGFAMSSTLWWIVGGVVVLAVLNR